MKRAYYSESLAAYVKAKPEGIRDRLAGETAASGFSVLQSQLDAWDQEIAFLQGVLGRYGGSIYLEYSIPRMGRRADAVLLIGKVIFVVEFKVGEQTFTRAAVDQAWDYALDLKNFHETSHHEYVVPVLIATGADASQAGAPDLSRGDKTCPPVSTGLTGFPALLDRILETVGPGDIDCQRWESGRYRPTPTIIEAAMALYSEHSVKEISRSDAEATNLSRTSDSLMEIIRASKDQSRKSICFVTGVPGAGKTLVGLNTATQFMDKKSELYSVFLSGNGPLVKILCEALARDKVRRSRERGEDVRLPKARSDVKAFIQNVHHFRDECLLDTRPPTEHVALFDEAQRAWDLKQTSDFMRRKKKRPGFTQSEPEYLISCLDRHQDWAVVICLVGGGQEINTGEAGIREWVGALKRSFPEWHVHISSKLSDSEYGAGRALEDLAGRKHVDYRQELHLATSMRSFRAENVSTLVKQILDLDLQGARDSLAQARKTYPILLTRRMDAAKRWLRSQARGSERYGIVVSSQAERLRPHAISVRSPVDPVHWFLDGKEDVRSSYYLEDVATEFHVQGLEVDWACVAWDADLRYAKDGWKHWSFRGDRWNHIHKADRKRYLTNAYRVLLTRARQGMVIVVPEGDPDDPTRAREYYDPTHAYLKEIGIPEI